MGTLARASFSRGWLPDADPTQCPPDALLRADNLILDELGALSLRYGSVKINALAFADTDIHSLYTAVLSGTRYRMAGATNAVYANGTSIASGVNGANDIAFGSHRGQILFARGTTTKKYDGTTVRNWGIGMTGGVPTVVQVAPDKKVFVSGASTENPALVWTEDDGTGAGYAAGYDGTANAAAVVRPNTTTGRAVVTKTFAAATDFTTYDGGKTGTDDDTIAMWLYLTEPALFNELTVLVDVNDGTFTTDNYIYHFIPTPAEQNAAPPPSGQDPFRTITDATAFQRRKAQSASLADGSSAAGTPAFVLRPDAKSWYRVLSRRGDWIRVGATAGKDWSTVKAVRIVAQLAGGGLGAAVELEDLRIFGGTGTPISGQVYYRYVYAYNSGTYVGLSAPSAPSAPIMYQSNGGTVTVPADAGRDSQVNEIWLYRQDDGLDQFYRVAVQTGVAGAGSVAITDVLSDQDALITDLPLAIDNGVPPAGIVSIAGPYYDRTFALTATDLYPSRQLNPDSFSAGQVVHLAGADETAFWVAKAFGGLYLGTSKDIYQLSGDGTELPDGTINFTLTPLNVDYPPLTNGLAQEGNLLIYFASDGWRAMNGAFSLTLVTGTQLLYRGQTRHGVSPVNVAGGRFRAALARGQVVCITPEGASTTSSAVLYRYRQGGAPYRHVYPQAFRSIYREPDGTLIAGDAAGFVRVIDTGTQDDAVSIPVTLWTKVDDDGVPWARKDPWDFRAVFDSGNVATSVAVHLDGASAPATTLSLTQNGQGQSTAVLHGAGTMAAYQQIQLRITVTTAAFRWLSYGIAYRDRPLLTLFSEPKPKLPSLMRRRFSGLQVVLDTIGSAVTVTPVLDDVAQTPFTVTTSDPVASSQTFPAIVGRDLWARISGANPFEFYQVEPRVLEELPAVFQGTTPRANFSSSGVKTLSGIQLRVCTLGVARTVTVYLDDVPTVPTFTVTSALGDPIDATLDFPASLEATEVSLHFDGDVELYTWAPSVTSTRPLGVKTWDSGPLDLGSQDLVWLRFLRLKVRASATLTVTPYFDSLAFAPVSVVVTPNADTTYLIPVPRGYVGRQPRLVITSAGAFFPYWVECIRRTTGVATEKGSVRVPLTLGTAT